MSVVTVSDTTILVTFSRKRCVLQLPPSTVSRAVVGIGVCASGVTQQVWLFSRDGLARTLAFSSYKIAIPSGVFSRADSEALGPIIRVGTSIGCIRSVASIPGLCSRPQSANCACRVVACGSQGYAEVSLDHARVVHTHMWPKLNEAVVCITFLTAGRLSKAISSPPTPGFIAVTMGGAVCLVSGTRVSDASSPATHVAHLRQVPVDCVANSSSDIVVVTGKVGSILVLYADSHGHIGVHRTTVGGDPCNLAPKTWPHFRNFIIVKYTSCSLVLRIIYDAQAAKVIVRRSTGDFNVGASMVGDSNTGASTDVRASDAKASDARASDARASDARASDAADSDAAGSDAAGSDVGDSDVGDSDVGNSNAGDSNAGDSNAGESNTGHSSAVSSAAHINSDLGSSIRLLLRSIGTIADLRATNIAAETVIERLLSSYNAARLFAIQSKGQKNPLSSSSNVSFTSVHCWFSITADYALDSPKFDPLLPVLGRSVFLTASLQNRTHVTISNGWALHIRVAERPYYARSNPLNGNNLSNAHSSGVSSLNMPAIREMCAPLENIKPGATREISFPISIASHRPLYITSSLNFRHPEFMTITSVDNIDIQVILCTDKELDIIDMSKSCKGLSTTHDTSHKWLNNARSMRYFNPKAVEKRQAHPTSLRFSLPVSSSTIFELLKMEEPVIHYKTVLDAQLSVSIEETGAHSVVSGKGNGASVVTIMSAAHVLPFVHAAILSRIVNFVKRKTQNKTRTEQTTCPVAYLQIQGANNIDRWQRNILDMTGNWRQHERNAESNLVKIRRELKDERLYCISQGASSDFSRSYVEAYAAYMQWYLKIEDIWTPEGVKYLNV